MCEVAVIVTDAFVQKMLQAALINDNYLVEQVAAASASIRPQDFETGSLSPDAEAFHRLDHYFIEVRATVKDQIARRGVLSVALGERDEVWGGGSDVETGYEDESAAQKDRYMGLVVPDEVGEEHAGKQLGVVVLGDVGRRGVLDCDVEAEGSGGTEQAHGEESDAEAGCEWCGMEEHKREAGNGSNQAGEERQALG